MSAYESFKDYMFYLLHKPLKTKSLYILFNVLGAELDDLKQTIFQVREQSSVLTASGKYLELHGKDRDMYRYRDEDDEAFRKRLISKFEISKKAGTFRGIELVLNSMGYKDSEIKAMYIEDETRWAEFLIDLNTSEKRVTLQDIALVHNEIMKVKQASSKPNYLATNNIELNNSIKIGLLQSVKSTTVVKGAGVDCNINSTLTVGNKISIYRKIMIKGAK